MTNNYSWALTPQYDYLAHYGTKGMKWGERRYQLKDGTLTPAGRERYYRNLHGSSSIGGRIKAKITGKYADGTETYSHYRNRAKKAAKGRSDADNDYLGPVGNYLGARRAAKYGKGMSDSTLNAGKTINRADRNAQIVTGIGGAVGQTLGQHARTAVANITGSTAAAAGASFLSSYAVGYGTATIAKEKIYGSQKSRQAEKTLADSYEKSTRR